MHFKITDKCNMQVFICNSYVRNFKCIFVVNDIYHIRCRMNLWFYFLAMIPFVCHFLPLCLVSEGMPLFLCQLSCLSVCLFQFDFSPSVRNLIAKYQIHSLDKPFTLFDQYDHSFSQIVAQDSGLCYMLVLQCICLSVSQSVSLIDVHFTSPTLRFSRIQNFSSYGNLVKKRAETKNSRENLNFSGRRKCIL